MKNVSAAIILQDGQILITRRAPGEKLAGFWEFPGGKQEPGETIQQCLVRELREELELHVDAGEVLVESTFEYPGGAIRLVGVEAVIASGNIVLSVHDAYQWVGLGKLLNYELAPADIPIAKWILENYGD